jgi:hypothetical protein
MSNRKSNSKAKRTSSFDIDEVDVMSSSMYHSPECHGIGHLSMEPDVFIGREQPGKLGANDADDVAKHGKEDETTVVSKTKTGPTGCPNGELETIQSVEFLVGFLMKEMR